MFEKINKIEYLATLKKNKENTQIINVRNKLVYYRHWRHQKDNKGKLQMALYLYIWQLKQIDLYLEKYKLPQFILYVIDHLNSPKPTNEIDFITLQLLQMNSPDTYGFIREC